MDLRSPQDTFKGFKKWFAIVFVIIIRCYLHFLLVDICTHNRKAIVVPNCSDSHCILYHHVLTVTLLPRPTKKHCHVRISFKKQSVNFMKSRLFSTCLFKYYVTKWKVYQALLYTKVQLVLYTKVQRLSWGEAQYCLNSKVNKLLFS